MARFSRLEDGRVLDTSPMAYGKVPLVFNPASPADGWTVFDGKVGDVIEAKPLTDEEAASFTS